MTVVNYLDGREPNRTRTGVVSAGGIFELIRTVGLMMVVHGGQT